MKKAKVKNGIIKHVWPWVKALPDGTQVIKELPPQYRPEKLGKYPDCIIDVPDEVQPNWVWNEEEKKFTKRVKVPVPPPHSALIEVIAEKLGIPYEDLWNEIKDRKRVMRAGTKKD